MSLDFGLKKIKDYETVCWAKDDNGEDYMVARCELLIWGTMMVHLSRIEAKNIDEWLVRLRMVEQAHGGLGRVCEKIPKDEKSADDCDDGHRMVAWKPTREELEKFVGLWTNVHTKTRAGFKKIVAEGLERDAEQSVRDARRREQKEAAA